jgi:hypothetical protein
MVLEEAVLVFSVSPPGYYSTYDNYYQDIAVFSPRPCHFGTARDTVGFGPCPICPPGTKNNGSSNIKCEPCKNDSVCLRGTANEFDLGVYSSRSRS